MSSSRYGGELKKVQAVVNVQEVKTGGKKLETGGKWRLKLGIRGGENRGQGEVERGGEGLKTGGETWQKSRTNIKKLFSESSQSCTIPAKLDGGDVPFTKICSGLRGKEGQRSIIDR